MRAVVPVGADPNSPLAAVSTVYRVWEEYGVDRLTLLATSDAPGEYVDYVRVEAERLAGRVDVERVEAGVEELVGASEDKLLGRLGGILGSHCDGDGLVVAISPAGRRLATALALAATGASGCPVSVVHVHFYFGPWSGLPYPYTPRRLEPLVVMHGEPPKAPGAARGLAPSRATRLFDAHCRLGSRVLPPLRCMVAEASRILNEDPGASILLPGGAICGRLRVEVEGRPVGEADLCRERDAARLAGSIASTLYDIAHMLGDGGRHREPSLIQALAWTGLAHLKAQWPQGGASVGEESFHRIASSGRPLIVDTSLIYYGAHRYAWEGGRILVPECAVVEIHAAWSEAAKRGRLESPRDAAAAQAYLGLRDLLGAGASIVPAPAGKCDVSIPKADPVVLNDSYIATTDDGAFRYWESHPASKLATPVKVSFDPLEARRQEVDARRDPRGLSRMYYALIQALILLSLLANEGLIGEFRLLLKSPSGDEREVHLPVKALKKRLYTITE